MENSPTTNFHDLEPVSGWVKRWSHLIAHHGAVLDIACGKGRHMKWFADRGHPVTGVDRSPQAIETAACYGETLLADIENGPWPLMRGDQVRQFDAVLVTNYLWRPLFQVIAQSVLSGGLLIYETFSKGNETVGRPSRADYLLQPSELMFRFKAMHTIAFEEGFLENPPRFVQRIVCVNTDPRFPDSPTPARYLL